MGIVRYFLKVILATAFFLIASLSYILGVQRSNIERDLDVSETSFRILREDTLRKDLVTALQAGALQQSRELARKLALLSPVSEVPLEAETVNAFARGDETSVAYFVTLTLARQPRSLVARLQKFRVAAEDFNYVELLHSYERLAELRSLNGNLLSEALIGVFRTNNDWRPLQMYLESRPPNGLVLVNHLLREPQMPSELEGIMSKYPSQQERYLRRLVADYGYVRAYRAWQSYANFSSEADQITLPFNGTFQSRSERAPFNWTILSERAELQSTSGLFVSFSGTGTPLIARQVFSAPSGDYKLSTIASGRMQRNGGALEWRVFCTESKINLAELLITSDGEFEHKVFEAELTVPDKECSFQTIELLGRAGRFPESSQSKIRSVALIPTFE